MTTGIILSIILIGLITCLIVFRNTLFVKKYWRYALILIPALLVIIVKLVTGKAKTPPTGGESDFVRTLDNVKEKLQEANMTATVEVTAAREKNQVKLEELKKVTQITDDQERRKRLAELMG
jgi:hypothetical protein